MKTKLIATALAACLATGAVAQTQGVTDTEILVGSNQDMSGPFAAFGAPAVQAAQLHFDEVNAAGGIHGRTIRLIAEDHAYQMPKAMSAINKLVNSDKVFAMLLSLGTPMNIAAFPLLEQRNVPNLSPLTAARQMDTPLHPLRFAATSSYYDQMVSAVKYVAEQEGLTTVCSMYIPSDFGNEIAEGTKASVDANGLSFGAETKHKPDELDFVGALSKLNAEGCQLVTVALGVRQAITAIGSAKKMGLDMAFLGASASFHTAVAKVPGGVTEGFYAASGWTDLVSLMDDPEVAEWVEKMESVTGEFPGTGAVLGHSAAFGFTQALERAGPDLTTESFLAAMEGLSYMDKVFGVPVTFGEDDHKGADAIVISQVQDGNWVELTRE